MLDALKNIKRVLVKRKLHQDIHSSFSPTSVIPYNSRLANLTFSLPYPFCSKAEAKYSKAIITNTVSVNMVHPILKPTMSERYPLIYERLEEVPEEQWYRYISRIIWYKI